MNEYRATSPPIAGQTGRCTKKAYSNQGAALRVLRRIQRLGLPHNRQRRAYWCENGCEAWHLTSHTLREAVDLADGSVAPLRQELRHYESPDVARTATFVAVRARREGDVAALEDLRGQWQRRYPRHAGPDAPKSASARLTRGLRALDHLSVIRFDFEKGLVAVQDLDRLYMIAGNLEVLEDDAGFARKPSQWPRSPEVPSHLRAVQACLIAAGDVGWRRLGKGMSVPQPTSQPASASRQESGMPHRDQAPAGWVRGWWRRLVSRIAG